MFLFCVFSIKDQISLKLVKCFWCYSASTNTSFGFCSCSELLQLKSGKKKFQGNANCSAPKTVIGLTNVANERYLPYLQLWEKAFFVNFMYWRCKSGPKLGKNNNNGGLSQDTNIFCLTKYFVITGNLRYLWGKKRIFVFHKIYQILEVKIAQFWDWDWCTGLQCLVCEW